MLKNVANAPKMTNQESQGIESKAGEFIKIGLRSSLPFVTSQMIEVDQVEERVPMPREVVGKVDL